jgi:tetratricopeptide (TPR) repeat protein
LHGGAFFCVTVLAFEFQALQREEVILSEIHITRDLLRAVTRGEIAARGLIELGWKHLFSLCPVCSEEFRAWKKELKFSSRYDSALKVMPALLERHAREEEKRRKEMERDFRALMRVPQAGRLYKIDRSLSRFRGTLLARRLLDESKKRMTTNIDLADNLAEAAGLVVLRTPESPELADLRALSVIYRANVARLRGRPDEARALFERARSIIRMERAADPLTTAEADSCEGVLALDLRQFEEAEELLNRSIFLYMLAAAKQKAAMPLVTLGHLYYEQGNLAQSVETIRQALTMINPQTDRSLFMSARFNLVVCLCEAGQYSEATEALAENRDLFEEFPEPFLQLRIAWLEARIAAGTGHPGEAENGFVAVREEMAERGHGYDAAMVSLDLALIYLDQGRTGELLRLAEEMHALFRAEEVHREALAAFLLFEEAARKEQLTSEAIRSLSALLKRVR